MKIFVLNAGSSSIKYELFHTDETIKTIAYGMVEKIGEEESFISFNKTKEKITSPDHKTALRQIEQQLQKADILQDFTTLKAIAHRVVHGGLAFAKPVLIDEAVIDQIRKMIPLAPLHNPANLAGILEMKKFAPDTPQIAFFDTAFHQSMPPSSYRYALPEIYYHDMHIRRYGFHGISHEYLAKESAEILGKPLYTCNLITLHLGNGASAAAIKQGKSIHTSMGFTPLEGLVMGTRSGDLDPGILLYLAENYHFSGKKLDHLLNHESGLKGLCGTNDMREIIEKMQEGDEKAKLAFTLFCQKIKHYIGGYIALLGHVDAIIFSGGIGTNSPEVRKAVCNNMQTLGIVLNHEKNQKNASLISDEGKIALFALKTHEELEMARQILPLLRP